MLPDGTILTEHVWKRFRMDRRRSFAVEELQALRARLSGNRYERWRFALQDINLHVEPGQSLGLVGANGSGKSTLLKLLTRVMYQYAGTIEVAGRVGALIEVSAGIHPQLTGRENIYLYGSLLGLARKDVSKRFDDIVEFAEVGAAVDRMVKHYSSGMRMRLGFAVAAFLEPDVLLVDEVLAVGDAAFQQKCLDRMRSVLSQGTTLVFVSHDLAAVEATCSRGVWLNEGIVRAAGPIEDVMHAYRRSIEEAAEALPSASGVVNVTKATVTGPDGGYPTTQEPVEIELRIESAARRSCRLYLGVSEGPATPIFSLRRDVHLEDGDNVVSCSIAHLPLPHGRYYVWVSLQEGSHDVFAWHPCAHFDVNGPRLDEAPTAVVRLAPIHVAATWQTGRD